MTTVKNALKQLAPKTPTEKPEQVAEETSVDRQELVNLITIRDYVVNATANPAINRATVNYLNGALIMIDRKIISMLQSSSFKEYIGYENVGQAIQEVRAITDIKSGLKK